MSKLSDFLGGFGGGGGLFGGLEIVLTSSDITADLNTAVGIDTSNGEVTVTMPANPNAGDRVVFFDAAPSWGKHPATIKLNGDTVQYHSGAGDRFMISGDDRMIHLAFMGNRGWVDLSYFVSETYPTWYESTYSLASSQADYDDFINDREINILLNETTSGEYTIPEDGYYILGVCGSGCYIYNNESNSSSRPGQSSTISVNGSLILRSLGANKSASTTPVKVAEMFIDYPVGVIKDGPQLMAKSGSTNRILMAEEFFGLSPLSSNGDAAGSASRAQGAQGSSVALYLRENDLITYALGVVTLSGGIVSARGRARISQIKLKGV